MKLLHIFSTFVIVLITIVNTTAQENAELAAAKERKAKVKTEIAIKQAELDSLNKKSSAIQKEIEVLSGWMFGFGGTLGFKISGSEKWISSPNPTSKAIDLAISASAYANKIQEKYLWRNSVLISKQWTDIDIDDNEDDGLFQNGTVDILNASSLAGYRLTPKVALTALGELNSSISSFLAPGTVDVGVGATWTPNDNLVVIVHPLNYHFAWSAHENVLSYGALGAKLRAEYNKKYNLLNKQLTFSSTLTSFIPYSSKSTLLDLNGNMIRDKGEWEAGLFEISWINNVAFSLWNGVGVGVGFGLRKADFETQDLQKYYNIGLNYSF